MRPEEFAQSIRQRSKLRVSKVARWLHEHPESLEMLRAALDVCNDSELARWLIEDQGMPVVFESARLVVARERAERRAANGDA